MSARAIYHSPFVRSAHGSSLHSYNCAHSPAGMVEPNWELLLNALAHFQEGVFAEFWRPQWDQTESFNEAGLFEGDMVNVVIAEMLGQL